MTLTEPTASSRATLRKQRRVEAQLRAYVKANCGRSMKLRRAAIERGARKG